MNSINHILPLPLQQQPQHQYQQKINSQHNSSSFYQSAPSELLMTTSIEREAQHRAANQQAALASNSSWLTTSSSVIAQQQQKEKPSDLSSMSNKIFAGNQPTPDSPNNPYWFGRAGPQVKYVDAFGNPETRQASYVYDVRRRKLLDTLENRLPTSYQQLHQQHQAMKNSAANSSNNNNKNSSIQGLKPIESSHKNKYENPMKMTY